jgi:hypothetical protein
MAYLLWIVSGILEELPFARPVCCNAQFGGGRPLSAEELAIISTSHSFNNYFLTEVG